MSCLILLHRNRDTHLDGQVATAGFLWERCARLGTHVIRQVTVLIIRVGGGATEALGKRQGREIAITTHHQCFGKTVPALSFSHTLQS